MYWYGSDFDPPFDGLPYAYVDDVGPARDADVVFEAAIDFNNVDELDNPDETSVGVTTEDDKVKEAETGSTGVL